MVELQVSEDPVVIAARQNALAAEQAKARKLKELAEIEIAEASVKTELLSEKLRRTENALKLENEYANSREDMLFKLKNDRYNDDLRYRELLSNEQKSVYDSQFDFRSREIRMQNEFRRKMAEKQIESEIRISEKNNNVDFQTSIAAADVMQSASVCWGKREVIHEPTPTPVTSTQSDNTSSLSKSCNTSSKVLTEREKFEYMRLKVKYLEMKKELREPISDADDGFETF